MSVPLIVNGVTYNYPVQGDTNWGPVLTAWSTAVTNALSIISGGNASFLTITSQNANPATTGFLRLSNTDAIDWRNFTNTGNLALAVNSSNQLTFNGVPIGASASLTDSHIFVGNASNQPADVAMSGDITITNTGVTAIGAGIIVNADINAAAAIAVSKLAALTASRVVVSDASGFLTTVASPTLTELGYVGGVTSAIQTQLNTLTSNQANYLPLAGGTMSGAINMASNKILSLSNGTNSGDAVNFGQIKLLQSIYASTTSTFATTSTTYVQTNLAATITPTSSSNRVLIIASGVGVTANSGNNLSFSISRNGTDVAGGTAISLFSNASQGTFPVTLQWVDSPASTSALTYSVVIKSGTVGQSVTFGNGQYQTMLLQEIV